MDFKTIAEVTDHLVTSSAVVVGGIWVYFKFARGRTFAHRAELELSATVETDLDTLYLRVVVLLKNTGLSRLPLNKDMKAVRIFGAFDSGGNDLTEASWERIVTSPILDQHEWLESQEIVQDTVLYRLQSFLPRFSAYQAEALIGSRPTLILRKRTRWRSRAVVLVPQRDRGVRATPETAGARQRDQQTLWNRIINSLSRPRREDVS